jgi:hypothetical protein
MKEITHELCSLPHGIINACTMSLQFLQLPEHRICQEYANPYATFFAYRRKFVKSYDVSRFRLRQSSYV